MYLYPFKIFTVSKNKRLFLPSQPNRTIGIYDAEKMSYSKAFTTAEEFGCKVSILLGNIINDIKLICLDLDDCFNEETGELDEETREFLKEFNRDEYEVSSSGTGIHIYILTKQPLETFIIKDMEGSKSFECYTNKRHIVTTAFDFYGTNLIVGGHDEFLSKMYEKANTIRNKISKEKNTFVSDVKETFQGDIVKTEQEINGKIYKRTPVTDMYTLRGIGYKDPQLISIIDESPDAVDQSAHDAKLVRKLMYYTLSFESAWEMAKKTNYYKAKDKRHKEKFDNPMYIEKTKRFIYRGRI